LKLLTQPGDGVDQLVKGISRARKNIEIVIFRFDRAEIEEALEEAAERGVFVHALIAFTNRGGEKNLRKLEMRLLDKGITVARTADDLIRYHGKMMIVDHKELFLLSFNFTHLDIDHSRSFGLVLRTPALVREADKLFEADTKRQSYSAGNSKFIVSPVNAREILAKFVKGAKKELLIYDPEISDREILRILQDRRKAGVEVRVIGKVTGNRLPVRILNGLRLHTRTILRDGKEAFLGSQSLRRLELDSRREIGIIFRNQAVVKTLSKVFEKDWRGAEVEEEAAPKDVPLGKAASRKINKAIQRKGNLELLPKEVEETVKIAVKEAVKDSVKDATKQALKSVVDMAEVARTR
jgi:cardiolipin synthase